MLSAGNLKRIALAAIAIFAALPAADAFAGPCPQAAGTTAFERWGDYSSYALLPGGRFEGSLSWLGTGAPVLYAQNNPFNLSGAGAQSVRLRGRDTLTSLPFCVDADHPHMRFVTRALDASSRLMTELVWTDGGAQRTTLIGEHIAAAQRNWGPSQILGVGTALPTSGGRAYVAQVRFRLRGNVGDWLIDDVYLDPAARR